MADIQRSAKQISCEQYLRASGHPVVDQALKRYDRGDINYIEALEISAVALLGERQVLREACGLEACNG